MAQRTNNQSEISSKKFNRDARLFAYCAMAGGALAAAVPAEAAIVYSGIKDLLVDGSHQTVAVDIDNSGATECSFKYYNANWGYSGSGSRRLELACPSAEALMLNGRIRNFPQDSVFDTLTPWAAGGQLAKRSWSSTYSFVYNFGYFSGQTGFIGVRFDIASARHYGWIRFAATADSRTGTIIDWAYQNTADTSIATGVTTGCIDNDGDTYGVDCPAGPDCADNDTSINPGAAEVCANGLDDNCDGQTDEAPTFYRDFDNDTYGNPAVSVTNCVQPAGYVADSADCNDNATAVNPGATEVCNGFDDNCDGQTDEGLLTTYYRDSDNDTYGNPSVSTQACAQPAGYVMSNADCNDAQAAVKPGAAEVCNGIDDDCDTDIDEGISTITFYEDADGDGFGVQSPTSVEACVAPPGYAANARDCNDDNAAAHPRAMEVLDCLDNDCDGAIDEGLPQGTFYQDSDNDTYGNPSVSARGCAAPAGYVADSTDCDDSNAAVHANCTAACTVQLKPATISRVLSLFKRLAVFRLQGDESALFTDDTEIDWGTEAVQTLRQRAAADGQTMTVVVWVKPRLLEAGATITVQAGGCSGELTVKPL